MKKFQEALDNLIKTKIIYNKIAQYKDALEAIIYKEKINQIDTFIRMCSFNLMGMMDATKEEKMLADMLEKFPQKQKLEQEI